MKQKTRKMSLVQRLIYVVVIDAQDRFLLYVVQNRRDFFAGKCAWCSGLFSQEQFREMYVADLRRQKTLSREGCLSNLFSQETARLKPSTDDSRDRLMAKQSFCFLRNLTVNKPFHTSLGVLLVIKTGSLDLSFSRNV